MILGLVGLNASGKGEVVKFLQSVGFEAFSLSDEIRRELISSHIEPTREALTAEGRRLRQTYGADILVRRVIKRFTPGLNQVIDSIRNPEEVNFLKTFPSFFLIHIDAPEDIRFQRIIRRSRKGDVSDLQSFREAEAKELKASDPAGQSLLDTISMADFTILNDSDLDTLYRRIKEVFREAAQRISKLSWDEYFMKIAEVVAERSSCVKRRAAAVVVRDKRVISTGYNGTPIGVLNCNEGGCERCLSLATSGSNLSECVCSHAEENAIVQAALHGVSLKGATIYSLFSPCLQCAKMIINAGIREVVYLTEYPALERPDGDIRIFQEVKTLLTSIGINFRKFSKT